MDQSAPPVGVGIIRVKFDGPIIIGNGPFQVALLGTNRAPVTIKSTAARVKFNGSVIVSEGTF